MSPELLDMLSPWLIAGLIMLAMIAFLRVLASYRQGEVARHDTKREIERLRQEQQTRKSPLA